MKTKYSKCIEFLLTMINFIVIYYISPSLCSTPIAISQSWGVEGCMADKEPEGAAQNNNMEHCLSPGSDTPYQCFGSVGS